MKTQERTRYSAQDGHPAVRGRCASCGSESLFLGSNGYVTCSVIGCKAPGATHDLVMEGREPIEAIRENPRLRERIRIILDFIDSCVAKCHRCASCNETARDFLLYFRKHASEAFQARVRPWMVACFGEAISNDATERNHRFLEEALELAQASGCTEAEVLQLVAYVYGRPSGHLPQEVGGVMVTLAALCLARGVDMHGEGETELARVWTCIDKIRAKQAAKPKHSPLPGPTPIAHGYVQGRRYLPDTHSEPSR